MAEPSRTGAGRSSLPRPSPDRIEEVSRRLAERGFEIVHQGRFGVSVSAQPEDFQRVLGVTPVPGEALSRPIASGDMDEALRDLIDYIEIVPTPDFYSGD